MSPAGFDLSTEADLIRLYVSSWRYTKLGDEASERTRLRVLDAVERLLAASREAV